MRTVTVMAFPNYIGVLTGIAYARVGVRKVHVTRTDGTVCPLRRNQLAPVLPEGNALAFELSRLIDGTAWE